MSSCFALMGTSRTQNFQLLKKSQLDLMYIVFDQIIETAKSYFIWCIQNHGYHIHDRKEFMIILSVLLDFENLLDSNSLHSRCWFLEPILMLTRLAINLVKIGCIILTNTSIGIWGSQYHSQAKSEFSKIYPNLHLQNDHSNSYLTIFQDDVNQSSKKK